MLISFSWDEQQLDFSNWRAQSYCKYEWKKITAKQILVQFPNFKENFLKAYYIRQKTKRQFSHNGKTVGLASAFTLSTVFKN